MILINKSDSMTTIQKKLNSVNSIMPETVKFERGTYKITKQLVISRNTIIDLNGARLQRKASIQSIFINKVTKNTKGYNGDGDITIRNGIFEGMGGYSYDNLLTFFHSHDILIRDCTFQDILCHGIEFNSSNICEVCNCKFLGYNLKDSSNAYKEMIQIDHAGYSGFVLSGSSKTSPCYDGTCCTFVSIHNCEFNKSNTRDYPYACIGEHSQIRSDNKHKEIRIYNNKFYCKKNPDIIQACLSFTNMENVYVFNNVFETFRVSRIYSKDYSYTVNGSKVAAKSDEGICKNIEITDNVIRGCKNNKEAFQKYNNSGKANHTNILYENNVFDN